MEANSLKTSALSIIYYILSFFVFGISVFVSYLLYGSFELSLSLKYIFTLVTMNSLFITLFDYILKQTYKENYEYELNNILTIVSNLYKKKVLLYITIGIVAIGVLLSFTNPFFLLIGLVLLPIVLLILGGLLLDIFINYTLLKLNFKKRNISYKISLLLLITNIFIVLFL